MNSRAVAALPRKSPVQARSRATVDAIVTAAAQVLAEQGLERATTARVAERAGVSIGSLYQYFPSKEALVAALIERYAGEIVLAFEEALFGPAVHSLEDGLWGLIRTAASTHRIDPALHKILNEQIVPVGQHANVREAHLRTAAVISSFLRARADEVHPARDPEVAAVVVQTALEGLIHRNVNEAPWALADGRLVNEAFALIAAYLRR